MARVWLLTAIMALAIPISAVSQAQSGRDAPELLYLYLDTCLSCQYAQKSLDNLLSSYPDAIVTKIDIADSRNRALVDRITREHGIAQVLAPTVILGDQVWIGFTEETSREIEDQLSRHFRDEPVSDRVDLDEPGLGIGYIPLGSIGAGEASVVLTTGVIGFLDGINPCSLWALTVLLAYAMNFRSRRKLLLVGIIFILVTAVVYGLFMVSILTAVTYLQYYTVAGVIVNVFMIGVGIVNIKDYFSYKKGISLTISDNNRNTILHRFRNLLTIKSPWALAAATILVAACTAIVELPCTAGFPVVWLSVVSERGITGIPFYFLLGLYLLAYVLIAIGVLSVVAATLKIRRISIDTGRKLKLFSGLAIAYFGIASVWLRSAVSASSLLVIALSAAASYALITSLRISEPRPSKREGYG